MRVSRDEYWDLIRRASRGGTGGKQAQATLWKADPLDVLKWTAGIAALPGGDPLDFSDWQSELRSLIPDLVKEDTDDYQRIGYVPTYAPTDTYELTEEQYWDGVRDLAKYTARHVDAIDWPTPPKKHEIEIATGERLSELIHAHPFVNDLPRILDVIRHSQNLGPALEDHARWVEDKTEISFNWEQPGKGVQFALGGIAFVALWEDAWRLLTSTGMYVPNAGQRVSRDGYWAAIKAAARGGVGPLAALDPLDVLKWTNGLRDAGGTNLLLTNVAWSLSELAKDAAQVDAAAWTGRIPDDAPADTYELTEEQYWDGVRDLLAAARRALAGYTFASSDEEDEALKVELFELASGSQQVKKLIAAKGKSAGRWNQHPFTVWPRALDTIRHSQNLQAQLTADDIPNRQDMLDMWYDGSSPATQTAIEDIAQIALWADALRMGTSAGTYVPNGIYEAMAARGFVQSALDRGLKAWGREVAPGVVFIIENPHDPTEDIDSADVGVVLVEIGPKGSEVMRRARVSLFQALSSAKALEEEFGGGRYAPNITPFSYWDHIKRIAPKVHYPPVYESDQQLMTFVASVPDALDAMRMSSEPGMIGPWLGHVSVSMQEGEKLFGALPGQTDRELTVAELLVAAGRVAAVADADHWGAARQPFQSPAPPLMTLDDYLRYVRDAALLVARSKSPSATFEALLDPLHTGHGTRAAAAVSAHPLIARVRGDAFPYRSLDVLHHTSHPEALWEDTRRRTTFAVTGDWWKAGFNAACKRADPEEVLVWLAAAAFAADVLDELGAIHLSKYAPNASADDLVEQRGWSHALADETLRSTGVAQRWNGRLYVLTDDAGDIVPEVDEPALVGVYVEDPEAGEWVQVGEELFPSLAQALERWAEVEVDPESGVG